MDPRYLTKINQISQLSEDEIDELEKVTEWFAFRTNEYYSSLIDWKDPDDPIRRLVIPSPEELDDWGMLDPSSEDQYTKAPGLQHKYRETALLLVSDMCGGFCRYCFRKRLFVNDDSEVARDVSQGLEYIRVHPEITNVLLTGGDPLFLPTAHLEPIIRRLRAIDHVHIIRIGSKMPAFNPYRILEDPALLDMIRTYSTPTRRIYIMTQFNHPRELSPPAIEGIRLLLKAGAVPMNQTPLIRGVNDDPQILAALFRKLSFIGVAPYYVFQCRPAKGNFTFSIPLEESYGIFEKARSVCSGLAKRARFVMSHRTGKIEVVGIEGDRIYFKYNQAADPSRYGNLFSCERNPRAYWFDDYHADDDPAAPSSAFHRAGREKLRDEEGTGRPA
jgi:lysine 2,3-aminomutase